LKLDGKIIAGKALGTISVLSRGNGHFIRRTKFGDREIILLATDNTVWSQKTTSLPKELRGMFCEQTRMQAVQEGFTPEEGRVDYGGKAQVPCQATIRYEDYREVAGVMIPFIIASREPHFGGSCEISECGSQPKISEGRLCHARTEELKLRMSALRGINLHSACRTAR
jgi:hypothetical protein